jgi:hypothetical protein
MLNQFIKESIEYKELHGEPCVFYVKFDLWEALQTMPEFIDAYNALKSTNLTILDSRQLSDVLVANNLHVTTQEPPWEQWKQRIINEVLG